MNNQQFALFENSDLVYLDSEYINCEIISLPKKYKPHVLSMTMQKNLPYKNAFNYFVVKLKENGVIDQILNQYKNSKDQKCHDLNGLPIGWTQVISAFCLLLFGFVGALISFL